MKNAKELLLEFTASSFRDPEKGAAMFAKDGAFEMPYLTTFGFPGRYQGREEIAGFFRFVRELYPGFRFILVFLRYCALCNNSDCDDYGPGSC